MWKETNSKIIFRFYLWNVLLKQPIITHHSEQIPRHNPQNELHVTMAITISFTSDDKEQVKQNHSKRVADELEAKIQSKNNTLDWIDDFNQCRQRFYNVIGAKGCFFPELKFSPERKHYRAILAWIKPAETIEFLCAVKKADRYESSNQAEIITQIETHPKKVIQNATERLFEKQKTKI